MKQLIKEQVIEAENQLLAAMKVSDVEVLDTLLHDDLLFLVPDGGTITKTMDLDAHRAGVMVIEKIERTLEDITIIDDTAVVTLVLDTKGTMMGNPIEGRFRYIRNWKLINGQLKVIGGACVAVNN